jgi:hypothetical protein
MFGGANRNGNSAIVVQTETNARQFVSIAVTDGPIYEAVSKVARTAL